MIDPTNAAPAAEMTLDQARAMVAQADAEAAAARKARDDAAAAAVKELVASADFAAFHEKAEAALLIAPKNTELAYAVNMLDRLASAFAG